MAKNRQATTFERMKTARPEVSTNCRNYRFPGRGQRITPVMADTRSLVELIPAEVAQILGHIPWSQKPPNCMLLHETWLQEPQEPEACKSVLLQVSGLLLTRKVVEIEP